MATRKWVSNMIGLPFSLNSCGSYTFKQEIIMPKTLAVT